MRQNSGFPGLRSSFSVEKGGGGGSTIPDVKKAIFSSLWTGHGQFAINVCFEVTKMYVAKQESTEKTEHFLAAYDGSRD